MLTVNCGYQRTLREHCKIGDTQTCDNLFGINQFEVDDLQNTQIKANSEQILKLSSALSELAVTANISQQQYSQTQSILSMLTLMINQQGADVSAINLMISNMNVQIQQQGQTIIDQQIQINELAQDIADLQNEQDPVIETQYPCGDASGRFDEAVLKLSSGKLLAYFESSGNRFLTELTPGSYRSTDYSPYCYFTVNANNEIVNARRQ